MNLGCKQYFQSCKTCGPLWVFFFFQWELISLMWSLSNWSKANAWRASWDLLSPAAVTGLTNCAWQASPQYEQHLTCPLIHHHIDVASGEVKFTFCGVTNVLAGKLSATPRQDCTGIKPPFLPPTLAYWYIDHCAKYLINRFVQNKNGTFKHLNIHIYDIQSSNRNKGVTRTNWKWIQCSQIKNKLDWPFTL